MMLYGSVGAVEASCYLFIGHAPRHKCEDFRLARRKIMRVVDNCFDPLALVYQQSRREIRRHIGIASSDRSNRVDQLMSAAALQDIAPRASLQCGGDVLLVFGSCQDDDSDVRTNASNSGGYLDAAASRNEQIEQHDVWNKFLCHLECIGRGRALAHDRNTIRLRQHADDAFTKHWVVVDDDDAKQI